jgi:NAD(P)-dependent dehydrogenase (short-subunit alcohol dehydrogenase family)
MKTVRTGQAGRIVLTTGANSGVGLATVLEVAKRGYRSVGGVRSESKAQLVKTAAREAGVAVDTVLLDVTDAQACAEAVNGLGPLWGLVNNAGYGGVGAVEDVSDDEARARLEAMLIAPIRLARLALPGMRAQGGGRIVNVSSIYGRTTSPLSGWYQAAKHALEAVSDALRVEVARDGIAVVLIEPGGFRTGIWEEMERDVQRRTGSRYDAAYRRSLELQHAAGPWMGGPARVARVIAAALDARAPRARYLVGADAQALALTEHFPLTAVKDRITRLALGL